MGKKSKLRDAEKVQVVLDGREHAAWSNNSRVPVSVPD